MVLNSHRTWITRACHCYPFVASFAGIINKKDFKVLTEENDQLDNVKLFGNLTDTEKDNATNIGAVKYAMHCYDTNNKQSDIKNLRQLKI